MVTLLLTLGENVAKREFFSGIAKKEIDKCSIVPGINIMLPNAGLARGIAELRGPQRRHEVPAGGDFC